MAPNLSESNLDRLIGRIYDLALEPELSEAVATEIGDLMGGAAIIAGWFELVDGTARPHGPAVRFDPELLQKFSQEFSTPDVNPVVARLETFPKLQAIPLEGLVDVESFHRSPIHNDFFRPQRFSTCLYSVLQGAPRYGTLAAYGFQPRGEFSPEEVAAFQRIIPHFTRCLQIRQRLLGAEQERFGATEALDRLPFGVVFVGFQCEVLFVNRAAEAVLHQADGLSVSHQRLRAATGERSAELDRLIGGAAATTAGRGTSAGGTLALSRPSGLRPLLVQVMPLRYNSLVFSPRAPAAVVFIADPEAKQELPEAVLSRTFGLTPQQAALARLLAEGHNLNEAAERLGVTRNTAHSHLNQIYQKTGTHRQSELVRLLLTSTTSLNQG